MASTVPSLAASRRRLRDPKDTDERLHKAIDGAPIGGAIVAGTVAANAATPTTAPSSSTSTDSADTGTRPSYPALGSSVHEALEKAVTGSNATRAQAAAVKGVGSGTAGAVTTDVSGNGYEVTVKKSDGSTVEVNLDSSFAVADHGHESVG